MTTTASPTPVIPGREFWRVKQAAQSQTRNALTRHLEQARFEWSHVGTGYKQSIYIRGQWGIVSAYAHRKGNWRTVWRTVLYLGRSYIVISKHAPRWVRNWGQRQSPRAIEVWAPMTDEVVKECIAFQRNVDKVERVKEALKQRSRLG